MLSLGENWPDESSSELKELMDVEGMTSLP